MRQKGHDYGLARFLPPPFTGTGVLRKSFSIFVLGLALAGCGADHDFRRATELEMAHRYPSAVKAFERFVARYPRDSRVPEALVRAGRVYGQTFDRCAEAKPLYERAVRESGGTAPWGTAARQGLLDCPNYFPLRDGMRWLYVDSQTSGKNMALELQVSVASDDAHASIDGAYYAGRRRFQDYHRIYAKENWAVWEGEGRKRVALLRYPFLPGMMWTGIREGRRINFSIESNDQTVTVAAGTFHNCLKVKESMPKAAAWQYQYYAPGVGRVKTTIGGPGFESPNTELKSVSGG